MNARAATTAPWTATSNGLKVRVRLTPKSSRDGVDGVENTADGLAFKVHVRAVPEKGEANKALVRAFADWLDVPKSTIEVAQGSKSRCKMLVVTGDRAQLSARIAERLANSS